MGKTDGSRVLLLCLIFGLHHEEEAAGLGDEDDCLDDHDVCHNICLEEENICLKENSCIDNEYVCDED